MGNKRKYRVHYERVIRFEVDVDAYDDDNAWDRVCNGEGLVREIPAQSLDEVERLVRVEEIEGEGE